MSDSVKFDPGIGQLVVDFSDFINNFYTSLYSMHSFKQKKLKFQMFKSSIEKYIRNNISFYLGCMIWAYYIYNSNISTPKKIDGNPFINYTEEQLRQYDYKVQIDFIKTYLDSYEKDVNYYTGQKYSIPQIWRSIILLYSEFLDKNEGFIHTKLTSDVYLPDKFKNINININIEELVNKVIDENNLELFLNVDFLSSIA